MEGKNAREKTIEFLKNYPHGNKFPINIVELAEKLGIKVIEKDLSSLKKGNIYGALLDTNGDKVIVIEESLSKEKKNFTIAHEIGHSVIHNKDKDLYYKDKSLRNTIEETEADDFAAEVLLPESVVQKLWQIVESYSSIPSVERREFAINKFVKTFGVTRKVVEYRLEKLGL